ncbi:aarF domain-containing protein kinase 1-like isoform X1 [Schistocerca gregaria]|nr:aarF domain-containing protein kinase 1-like isoform X1 [Schistocerca gregaria]
MRTFVNLKTGQRLLQLCQKNQATFIKVGQHIASLNQILPREITTALSVLQDKVEPRPYKDIAFIFQQELRKNPGQIFQYFEKEPVASASIAQVHKSVLLNGTKCAVKVQYPYIEYMIGGDLFTISILVHLMAAVFPNFSLTWILPQLNYVYEEIDFYREASNSKRAKANFKNYNNIYIPKVFDEYSTKKILVMEYMDGIKVNDIEALNQNHYNKFEIVSLINECVNIQIFQHGFVHADPHPGNLMVCKENDKLKLIVLDHGLYKEIPRDVRLNYCHLLQSLLKKDKSATQYYSRQLGAGDLHELLAVMMLLRIKSDIRLNGTKFSQKDLEKLRNVFGNSFDQGFKSTNQLLESIPRELLYAFKASNLVRSIAFDLGIPISVKFADTVRHALNGIQAEYPSTFRFAIKKWFEILQLKIQIIKGNIVLYLSGLFSYSSYALFF